MGGESLTPRTGISLNVRRVGGFSYTPGFWNLSVRPEGGGSYLQAPCWSLPGRSSVETSLLHVGVGVSPTHPLLESVPSVSWWAVSLTRPVMESVWMFVGLGISPTRPRLGSLSYTTCAGLSSRLSGGEHRVGSLSYTSRAGSCLVVRRLRSFSDTPRDGFCLLNQLVGSFSYTSRAVWLFVG